MKKLRHLFTNWHDDELTDSVTEGSLTSNYYKCRICNRRVAFDHYSLSIAITQSDLTNKEN